MQKAPKTRAPNMTTIADGSMWRALMWMLFALAMFSLVAISGREAAREIAEAAGRTTPILSDTLQIMIVRSFVGLVIVSAIIAASEQGFRQITSRNLLLHTGRNTTHYVGQFCWFHALSLIPLSQLFALEFTSPLWVALFAWLLLGERFSAERIAAVVLGFLGILVIVQPGVQSIGLGSG
ncbi:MAG: DMT family transporter, partial [Pseudomonadota bacterium]